MYPTDWHREYGLQTSVSAKKILSMVIDRFPVASSVEVGCGDGHWTVEAAKLHGGQALGLDGPWTNRNTLLLKKNDFVERNFNAPFKLDRKFDMAICLEVAEHVKAEAADSFVDSVAALADLHLFGAAIPFQGGAGHVNERWQSWWRDKFVDRGFVAFDCIRPVIWMDTNIHYWYRQNILIYVSRQRTDLIEIAEALQQSAFKEMPFLDVVHPEKFIANASYEAIHFKTLFAKLPRKLFGRACQALRIPTSRS